MDFHRFFLLAVKIAVLAPVYSQNVRISDVDSKTNKEIVFAKKADTLFVSLNEINSVSFSPEAFVSTVYIQTVPDTFYFWSELGAKVEKVAFSSEAKKSVYEIVMFNERDFSSIFNVSDMSDIKFRNLFFQTRERDARKIPFSQMSIEQLQINFLKKSKSVAFIKNGQTPTNTLCLTNCWLSVSELQRIVNQMGVKDLQLISVSFTRKSFEYRNRLSLNSLLVDDYRTISLLIDSGIIKTDSLSLMNGSKEITDIGVLNYLNNYRYVNFIGADLSQEILDNMKLGSNIKIIKFRKSNIPGIVNGTTLPGTECKVFFESIREHGFR